MNYAIWRFRYWLADKRMTYSDIDAAVESGKLKPGDMPGCPKDTDGDGNCGRPACPVCGTNEANNTLCVKNKGVEG